ncbi:MAG: hypothetical protein LBK83_01135 [Treponema sp.]|jgi:hypothetical protein|nr:hypothetical protein [Treponema sp.]
MKTIDDYMNAPEIVKMPEYLREIHAARRMIQDETKDMLPEEKGAYIHNEAISALAAVGIIPRYADFTNHGKLKSRQPVTQ